MNKRQTALSGLLFVLFLAIAALFLFPFVWMLSSSLKARSDIFVTPPVWIPSVLHWENYTQLFTEKHFGNVILNSLFTAMTGTAGALLFCSLAGFAFAKYKFHGKGLLFGLVLASLMVPMESAMIPLFMIYRKLGLIDSLWGVLLPRLTSAFGIFYMRQYCASIENELLEAGRIDGCSEVRMYFRLIVPILIPAFASLGIIFFVEEWNNFLWPTVLLRWPEHLTIAVAIRSLEAGVRTPYNLIMAGSVISILPMLAIIFIFQKQLISGLMDGSVKG
ncbi:carbohydrate ABC transporter permease [Paenibacillus alginolyticus]|uniref:carbohydrate ABC transporter permease n=1 Tax=Paenibacillus alginolyticus TaxID=59839 RepID=UPI0003FF5997|nr:carbohydrate ABC transporter permease [Paenibacillus alginolyticus]MCY9666627.1 carbohydrate ABC transporter permease [Paenibacillus alginolyticus]